MHVRATSLVAALLLTTSLAAADDAETSLHAAIGPKGEEIRLVTMIGGKAPAATLQVGKDKATKLDAGDAVGAIEVAHGKVVAALAVDDAKEPFRIYVVGAKEPTRLARPRKAHDVPFAMAMTPTPAGFTIFFQEVEAGNANEAHTYMVKLDKDGAVDGEAREVQVPWWIGDAAWNGHGYHLALYYAGDMNGVRLSMVSTDETGTPQQHPDWASKPGLVSDVHLVADGDRIRAYYRAGMGDRLYASDVTKIGNWGGPPQAEKDLGAIAATATIAINAKGQPVKMSPAPAAPVVQAPPKKQDPKKQDKKKK